MLEREPTNVDTPEPDLPALSRRPRRTLAALARKRPAA
jgi:hypothetical protein